MIRPVNSSTISTWSSLPRNPYHGTSGLWVRNARMILCWISRFSDFSEVINGKNLLTFSSTRCGQVDDLILFVNDEVPVFLCTTIYNGIHLGQFLHIITALHLTCQQITHLVQSCGLACPGNDQRVPASSISTESTIDDGIMQSTYEPAVPCK